VLKKAENSLSGWARSAQRPCGPPEWRQRGERKPMRYTPATGFRSPLCLHSDAARLPCQGLPGHV